MTNKAKCRWFIQQVCKPRNIHEGHTASMLAENARAFFAHAEGRPCDITAQEMLDVLLALGTPLRPSAYHPDGVQSQVPYGVRGIKGWFDLRESGKVKAPIIRALVEAWRRESATK